MKEFATRTQPMLPDEHLPGAANVAHVGPLQKTLRESPVKHKNPHRRFYRILLTVACLLCASENIAPVHATEFGGIGLTVAQATPDLPSNVKKAGRLYVIETIVVAALFGGAIYAVCRTSRRT